MTTDQRRTHFEQLAKLALEMRSISNKLTEQRDAMVGGGHPEFSAAYNLILQSLGDAALSADTLVQISDDSLVA